MFGPKVTRSKAPFMSMPRLPARYATSPRIPTRESLTESGPLPLMMRHPAEKFHGFRDIERLAARGDRLAPWVAALGSVGAAGRNGSFGVHG